MVRWINASVSMLLCSKVGHKVPYVTFSGDTDMVTAGLASVSSISKSEIVVGEMTPPELADKTGLLFENRMNAELGRDDLRIARLLRIDEADIPAGLSFQEFQRGYVAPRLVFACPRCISEEAIQTERQTLADYVYAGGMLTMRTDIELRD